MAGSTSATVSTSKLEGDECRRGRPRTAASSAAAFASAVRAAVPVSTARPSTICSSLRRRGVDRVRPAAASAGICGQRRRGRRRGRRRPSAYAGSARVWPSGAATTTLTRGLVEGVAGARGRARPGGRRPSRTGCPGSRRRRSSAWTWSPATVPTAIMATSQRGEEERPAPVGGLAESVEQGGHGEGLRGWWWAWAGGRVRRRGRGRCAGARRTARRGCASPGVGEHRVERQRRTGRARRPISSSRARAGVEGRRPRARGPGRRTRSPIALEALVGGGEQPRVRAA